MPGYSARLVAPVVRSGMTYAFEVASDGARRLICTGGRAELDPMALTDGPVGCSMNLAKFDEAAGVWVVVATVAASSIAVAPGESGDFAAIQRVVDLDKGSYAIELVPDALSLPGANGLLFGVVLDSDASPGSVGPVVPIVGATEQKAGRAKRQRDAGKTAARRAKRRRSAR